MNARGFEVGRINFREKPDPWEISTRRVNKPTVTYEKFGARVTFPATMGAEQIAAWIRKFEQEMRKDAT